MNKFIYNTFLVFIIYLVLIIIVGVGINIICKNRIMNMEFNGINKIIVGDSHAQKGVDDKIIPGLLNLGNRSEALIYSYQKISLFNEKSNIDTVFLVVSYHSFSGYYEKIIFVENLLKTYFFIFDYRSQFFFLKKVKAPLAFLHKSIAELIRRPELFLKPEWLGGYKNYYKNSICDTAIMDKRIKEQYYHGENVRGFSETNIKYFNKIVYYCQNNNIKLIVLNIPMHTYYIENVPKIFKDKFYSLINKCQLELFEYKNIELAATDFIPDGDHVSCKGAVKCTKYLNNYLKEKAR